MAKSPNAAGKSNSSNKQKKTTKDKPSQEIKLSPDKNSTVRIILEILVKNEATTATVKLQPPNSLIASLNLAAAGEQDCPDNKFAWSFDKTAGDTTIVSLAVGGFNQDLPADAGQFTTCILDPNDPPSITVVVMARTESGGGRGALSLTLNGKKVYDEPRELDNKGHGVLSIAESVKLPV
jgi:hypothetical protein